MRALVQRVTRASVHVRADVTDRSRIRGADEQAEGHTVGEIGAGFCVFVGVTHGDDTAAADKLADKVWNLRILDDGQGGMNVSLADRSGEVLVISQFTLYGDTSRGRRPSWTDAARPVHAEPLVDRFADRLRALGATVATGRFGADMAVELVNDGPVTLMLEV
jgi:D-aminoacyl-tRNA deacylase